MMDQAPKKKTGMGCAVLMTFVLIAAIVALFNVIGGGDDKPIDKDTATGPSRESAWVVCTQNVEGKLKAPSTAEFPTMSQGQFILTGNTYTVTSYVYADNSFGAHIRTNWTCTAEWKSGEDYMVSSALVE